MKNTLHILLVLIILSSCKKSGNGYVDGHVYEAGTGTPIAGAKVMLVISHYSNQGKPVSEVRTDANGYFIIKYTKTIFPSYSYYVTARADYYPANGNKSINNRKENVEFYLEHE